MFQELENLWRPVVSGITAWIGAIYILNYGEVGMACLYAATSAFFLWLYVFDL